MIRFTDKEPNSQFIFAHSEDKKTVFMARREKSDDWIAWTDAEAHFHMCMLRFFIDKSEKIDEFNKFFWLFLCQSRGKEPW